MGEDQAVETVEEVVAELEEVGVTAAVPDRECGHPTSVLARREGR